MMKEQSSTFPILLDGESTTWLKQEGWNGKGSQADWMLRNPQALEHILERYIQQGASMVLAPTMEVNAVHLARWGLERDLETIAVRLVQQTRQAAGAHALVGGALTSLGLQLHPAGEHTLEEIYDIYVRSVKALLKGGVDFFAVERVQTMAEARMALLAVKENCDKPVFLSMSVDDEGETLEDVNILAALVTLQSMGAAAFGLSCCPADETVEHLEKLLPYTNIPLYARPNAEIRPDGENTIPLSPERYAGYMKKLAEMGVHYLGGGRDAGWEYMKATRNTLEGHTFQEPDYVGEPDIYIASTEKDYFFLDNTVDISKPIQCSEDMSDEILQLEEDEHTFVINVEVMETDDVDFLAQNYYMFNAPLCVETPNIALLEAVARMYNGRLIIPNKDDFDPEMLDYLVKKYGLIPL